MKILTAEFAKGVVGGEYTTKDNLPQIAFLGRSNSGKSSVINSLTGKKNLVRSSKVPGKTIEANFFLINSTLYLVDFPGYGFAKRSIAERNKMVKRIFWYLESPNVRPEIVFLVIDANIGLTKLDWEMLQVVNRNKHNIIIIANKVDKLAKTKRENIIDVIKQEAHGIPVLEYSAKTNEGKENLFEKIAYFIK
ncbi:MAG: ribosome biogenesis GTP-binding protein YihA/YsxC [Candidatus Staskawiczbacteria bacterium]